MADWLWLAQFVNYEGYRAMYEAQSKNRMGLLIWMSHPAGRRFVWQTYDYYLDPDGGLLRREEGAEPLHIQWNAATENIEMVNYSAGDARGLTARVRGGESGWLRAVGEDRAAWIAPKTAWRLRIKHGVSGRADGGAFHPAEAAPGRQMVSENFYWRGTEEEDYRALRDLPKVERRRPPPAPSGAASAGSSPPNSEV